MLFQPKEYPTMDAILDASILDAHSDTIINGIDVFGYVQGVAYRALHGYDEENDCSVVYTDGIAI